MATQVGVSDAAERLAELLAEVESGGEVVIERAGRPVAHILADAAYLREKRERVEAGIRELRKTTKPVTTEEILAWKHEGHRY